jgi:four helix bundle protein
MKNEKEPPRGTDLAERTRRFAVAILRMVSALPTTTAGFVIGKQVLRSETSIGAQYREAMRARSNAEFLSKMRSALQELEETSYWLSLIVDGELLPKAKLAKLTDEARQLTAIFVASINTASRRKPT